MQIAVVGDRQRGLFELLGAANQVVYAIGAVEEGVLGVTVEMDEGHAKKDSAWTRLVRRGVLKWTLRIAAGTREAKNATIALYDAKNQPVATYTITSAWPVKWEGPALNATANEVAIETLEIAHEGLELEAG